MLPGWPTVRMPRGGGSHLWQGPTRRPTRACSRLYRLPREPDSEARTERIKDALSGAADVPLAVAEAGSEVAGIAARLVEEGNPNLEGDAMTALLLADAGVRSAAALTEINLSSANMEDDRLGRANELVDKTTATVRRATEDHGPG